MANAIYCRNGHFIGFVPETNPRYRHVGVFHEWQERQAQEKMARLAFCSQCGADNINGCLYCETTIEDDEEYRSARPSYCCTCGKPFPWIETALKTAEKYTDDLQELDAEDRADLKATFIDLTRNTSRTDIAANRFMGHVRKLSSTAGEVLKGIIIEIASEAAKRIIYR